MPGLQRFLQLVRTVELWWEDEEDLKVTIQYKQLGYTPAFTEKVRKESTKEDGTFDGFRAQAMELRGLIVKWDLTGSDGKELPRTDEAFRLLPWRVFNDIYAAVTEDMAVNPLKRKPIESISSPMVEEAENRNGHGPSASPTGRTLTPVS